MGRGRTKQLNISLNISYYSIISNSLPISHHGCLPVRYQDCAGAILCAAERATQVALQVNKLFASVIVAAVFFYHFSVLTPPNVQAIQCLGGNGYVNEYPTGRFLRDAKLYEIGAGTSEIRRMIIGRELFKEQ